MYYYFFRVPGYNVRLNLAQSGMCHCVTEAARVHMEYVGTRLAQNNKQQ